MKTILTFILAFLTVTFIYAQETGGPYTADENTVMLMHFDGNITNSASVGYNGIAHGSGVSYDTDGVHGQCLRLNNSVSDKQSWIEVPFYDELNIVDGFAAECWFKINSWGETTDGVRSLFRKEGDNGPADYEIILFADNGGRNGQVNLNCVPDETKDWGADGPIADILELNKWYHIVMYYSLSLQHVCCLIRDENYQEIFASRGYSATRPENSSELFRIGFGGWNESYFDGWIDEFRISNIYRKYRDDILADVDINALPDSVFIPLKDNWTVYQWPLAEYYPYNPEKGDIERANACGPTMLTRGIHYWEYPRFPKGEIKHDWVGLDWYANYNETEYLWDQMPRVFSANANEEEYGPAALLSAQVGVASRKTYDNMYCMPKFLKENFLFSKRTRIVFEEEYSKEDWENIIRNELNNGRICLVGGWGHYYIINGYNSKNQFFTDYSFNDNYWNDIKDFDYGDMQDMIIYMEPDWGDKKLELEQPKSGDLYQKGSELKIQWNSENISNLIIEYSADAGYNWHSAADNVDANTANYSWTIPDTISEDFRIRISEKDNLNVYRKCSGIEVYAEKTFAFEYPNKDTKFLEGTEQTIYWQSEGIETIKLEYSTDNINWYVLSDSVNVPVGNLLIQLPDIITGNITLKATELNESGNVYTSESFQLVGDPLWGGPYESDDETVLLMHFENDISNSANTLLLPNETTPIGYYESNFDNNLGKAFRNINGDIVGNAILVKNSENIDLGNDWTMEAWGNVSNIMGERTVASLIINKWEAFNIGAGWQHFGASVNFENETELSFGNPEEYQLDKWYHVALISDASSEKIYFFVHDANLNQIYKEARSFPEGSNGLIKSNEYLLTLGGLGGGSNFELDGLLDEIRIVKKSKLSEYFQLAFVELPFFDDFTNNYHNWTTVSSKGDDVWHISGDDGINFGKCARFYETSNPPQVNDDWLISPVFNTEGISNLAITFKYAYNADGAAPDFYYASNFDGNPENSEWTQIDKDFWISDFGWQDARIEIENLGESFVFALRYQVDPEDIYYFLMDNFNIEGTITNANKIWLEENNFKIYPNPITNESIISFETKTNTNVELSIFDVQGKKIMTLLDKNLNEGNHKTSINNSLLNSGIYFCKLSTEDGNSTIKLFVK